MNNVSFEVKKCVGYAFSRYLETQIKKFPHSVLLTLQTVKKLNLWEKWFEKRQKGHCEARFGTFY